MLTAPTAPCSHTAHLHHKLARKRAGHVARPDLASANEIHNVPEGRWCAKRAVRGRCLGNSQHRTAKQTSTRPHTHSEPLPVPASPQPCSSKLTSAQPGSSSRDVAGATDCSPHPHTPTCAAACASAPPPAQTGPGRPGSCWDTRCAGVGGRVGCGWAGGWVRVLYVASSRHTFAGTPQRRFSGAQRPAQGLVSTRPPPRLT